MMTTTGLLALIASRLTTRTGRVPACSLPSAGSSLALKTSPRTGLGRTGFPAAVLMGRIGCLERLPIAVLKSVGHGDGVTLIIVILRHTRKSGIDLGVAQLA